MLLLVFADPATLALYEKQFKFKNCSVEGKHTVLRRYKKMIKPENQD